MITENRVEKVEIPSRSSKQVSKFSFTKRAIEQLIPTDKRVYYRDEKVSGLTLAVDPTGRKVFVFYKKVQGEPQRVKIGGFPDLTIDEARRKAHEHNNTVAKGGNPGRERRAAREEDTLQDLFNRFMELYAKPHKRSWKQDVNVFNRYLHGWRNKRLSSITRDDVITLHVRIGEVNGKYAANRCVDLLNAMFNKFGHNGHNPAAKIPMFKETPRERFLSDVDETELARFFSALAQEENETIRDYILASLLTGGRRSNVFSMRWDELDWTRSEWRIPAEKFKNGKAQVVVLTAPAIDILARRKAASLKACSQEGIECPWVFPGRGKTGHLVEPKTCWKRVLNRAGISDLRLHDLRRTLGSWQAIQGAGLPIVGKSLGQSSIHATAVYAHLVTDPVRASVNKATTALLEAGGVAGLLGSAK